ncbi:APC family permease [Phocicoccus pinnipedialis]|uniref:Putative amino acid permease YhdG n=1 Tax=Phocicoccus pinnipedialis TaxID=110845 RepID=A0A6V7RLL0_9BACL|nr:amino acid transporter [Jeotgalicoccus pinnipedialis]CAD2079097.1 putative amino acid permease YhdG [Jeotgalicoccus pinnipedialis]
MNNSQERQELDSTMSKRFVWAIAYGSSIGWGAFILPGDWLSSSGTLGASLGILIGGLLMLVIAVSYGALTAKFPVSGGEFAFTYVGFGKYVSFIASWFLVFGYLCVVALNASAFSLMFKFILPDFLEIGYLYTIAGWDVYIMEVILSTIILIVFAIISTKGSGLSGNLQFIFCLFMAIVVTLLFLVSFFVGDFSFENAKPLFNESNGIWKSIILIVAIAPWMFVGFDNIPQAAEEFKFNANYTFRLIVFGIIASIITYVAMILVTSWIYPYEGMIDGSSWMTGSVVNSSMGVIGIIFLALAISFGVFTGLNGFFLSSSRLLFALGRAHFVPEIFAKLHKRTNTPHYAIGFVMIICLAGPWLGRTALNWIVDMSSVGVSIAFLATCMVAVKLFSKKENKNLFYVVFGVFGAIISFIFLLLLLVPTSPASLSGPSYIALLVWAVIGLVFFLLQFKKLKSFSKEELDYLILNETSENIKAK